MLRAEIEQIMRQNGQRQVDLVINETDLLAVWCELKSGKLYDYTGHVVNRKVDIWGFLKWENGKSKRVSWQEI